jgi:hypothetical protein
MLATWGASAKDGRSALFHEQHRQKSHAEYAPRPYAHTSPRPLPSSPDLKNRAGGVRSGV